MRVAPAPTRPAVPMEKLGLALSGGGFRATLFHLGVLRRLAELDLLRELSVISSVSGGSIVAAHYLLLLQRRLEQQVARGGVLRLAREDYLDLVAQLERQTRAGIARNPRARLFANLWENVKMVATWYPLGERMAGLYRRHFYREAAAPAMLGRLKLVDLRVGTVNQIDVHNRRAGATATDRPDRIPKLVLNATSLNGGSPFIFTAAEVGDPKLGFVRFDELTRILALKREVESLEATPELIPARLAEISRGGVAPGALRRRTVSARAGAGFRPEPCDLAAGFERSLAYWLSLRAAQEALQRDPSDREGGERAFTTAWCRWRAAVRLEGWPLANALDGWALASRLLEAEAGLLRAAKRPAWYLVRGVALGLEGAREVSLHVPELLQALHRAAPPLAAAATGSAAALEAVASLVVDLYQLRSAAELSHQAADTLDELGVHQAVAASANFPPVFSPFVLRQLYDPRRIARLGLSDGGVYDNQGTTALLDEACTHLIVSDAGGSLGVVAAAPPGRFTMSARLLGVLQGAIREQELARVHDAPRLDAVHRVKAVAFFHMESPPEDGLAEGTLPAPPAPSRLALAAAAIRTDLDAFEEAEMDLLVYQGYQLSDRFVRRYLAANLPPEVPEASSLPLPSVPAEQRTVLAGSHRFLRWYFRLAPPGRAALLGALALAVAALSAAGLFPSPAALGRGLAGLAALEWRALAAAAPWLPGLAARAATSPWTFPGALLLILGGLAVGRALPPTVRSGARLLVRNLWWFVLLAPLWLVLLLALYSWASWGGFALRRALRRPQEFRPTSPAA